MTTDEQQENIVPIKREISVLLMMDSYQDMTDEEIDSLIDYKIEQALKDAEIKLLYNKNTAETEARVAAYAETSQKTMELVESILNRPLELRTVEHDG